MAMNAGEVRLRLKVLTAQARAEIDKAIRSIDRLGDETSKESQKMRRSLELVKRQLDKVGDEADRTRRRTSNAFQGMQRAMRGIAGKARLIAAAFVSIGGALAIRALADARFQFDAINNVLLAAVGNAQAAGSAFDFVRGEAQRLGLDLRASADGFARLAAAARGTVLEGQAVRDIFSSVSEVATVMQMNTEQVNGTIRAFEQILSKGVVSAEEVRRQLGDRIPGAFNTAAAAMDVTTARFQEMLELGELASTDFLPRFAAELSERFAPGVTAASESFRAATNRMGTAWLELRGQVGEGGFIDSLTASMETLAEIMRDPGFVHSMTQAFEGFGNAIEHTVNLIDRLRRFLGMNAEGVGRGLDRDINRLRREYEMLQDTVDRQNEGRDVETEGFRRTAELRRFQETSAALEDLYAQYDALRSSVLEAAAAGEEFSDYLLDLLGITPGVIADFLEARAAANDLGEQAEDTGESVGELSDEMERLAERIRRDTLTPVERLEEEIETLNELFAAGALEVGVYERALEMLNEELENAEKAAYRLENNLEKLEEQQEAIADKTREAAEEMQEEYDKLADSIEEAFADVFQDIFDDGELEFEKLVDSIWNMFTRMLAEMAAQALAKPIIVPMVQALTGQNGAFGGTGGAGGLFGGSSGGGLGSLFSSLGSLTSGLGSLLHNMGSPMLSNLGMNLLSPFGGAAGTFGAIGGFNMPFSMIGSMLGGALGLGSGNQLQDSIAGGLGGFLGGGASGMLLGAQLGSFAGPIGAIVGSLAGVALSGLFGSDKDYPMAMSGIGIQNGQFVMTDSKELDGMGVDDIATVISGVTDTMNLIVGALGGSLTGNLDTVTGIGYIATGGRPGDITSKGFFGGPSSIGGMPNPGNGAAFQGVESADAAVLQAVIIGLENALAAGVLEGISQSDIDKLATADDLQSALESILTERELPGMIETLFRQFTDPMNFALENLLLAQEERRALLDSYGMLEGFEDQLATIEQMEIDQIFAQFGQSVDNIRAAFEQARERIDGFIDSMDAGGNSFLSPIEQYQNALEMFEEQLALAQGGDMEALGNITESAGTLRDLARELYASSPEFFEVEDMIRDALENLASPEAEEAAVQAELERQTEILEEIRDALFNDPEPGAGGGGGGGGGIGDIGNGIPGNIGEIIGGIGGGNGRGGGGISGNGRVVPAANTSDPAIATLDATLRTTSARAEAQRADLIDAIAVGDPFNKEVPL